jgi:hypothetical protein
MTQMDDRSRVESQDVVSRVWQMVSSNWVTRVIYVPAGLRLANLLVDALKTSYVLRAWGRFI